MMVSGDHTVEVRQRLSSIPIPLWDTNLLSIFRLLHYRFLSAALLGTGEKYAG